jgi:hypothetical protein
MQEIEQERAPEQTPSKEQPERPEESQNIKWLREENSWFLEGTDKSVLFHPNTFARVDDVKRYDQDECYMCLLAQAEFDPVGFNKFKVEYNKAEWPNVRAQISGENLQKIFEAARQDPSKSSAYSKQQIEISKKIIGHVDKYIEQKEARHEQKRIEMMQRVQKNRENRAQTGGRER